MRITGWLSAAAFVLGTRGASAAEAPASPSPAPPPTPAPSPPGELARAPAPPGPTPQLELHGAAYFMYYQPLSTVVPSPGGKSISPSDRSFSVPFASFEFKGRVGDFGMYLNPRIGDDKSRAFYPSNAWMSQAYAFYELPELTVKLGKIENAFSRLSDDTFYGSILLSDGMKLDMGNGVSFEGSLAPGSGIGLAYAAQYFLVDAHTNLSLRDRDTVWIQGAHRRHIAVLRLEPSYRFSSTASMRLGFAGQFCQVDLGKGSEHSVLRLGADLSLAVGPARFFGEIVTQRGKTVENYPIFPAPATARTKARPGKASAHNLYGLAGAEVQIGPVLPRYSFSVVHYRDVGVTEVLHIPGATVTLHDNASLLLEYAYWHRQDPRREWVLDNSLSATLLLRF